MEKAYRRVSRRLTALLAVASLAALLLVAAPAGAATSAQQGYSQPGARVQQSLHAQDPNATSTSKLPFTGLDVVAVLAVGGALLVVGFGVRRLSAAPTA